MVREGTREAKAMVSNPVNGGKNRTREKSRDLRLDTRARWEKENIFFIFIHAVNIYFSMQKNDTRHLCQHIGDGLRIP